MRTLAPPTLTPQDFARFWKHVTKTETCWLWSSAGIGLFCLDGHQYSATAISFMIHTGKYPELLLCHTCDTPRCINPEHLFEGTAKDNTQDMLAKGRGGHGRHKHLIPYQRTGRRAA